MREALGMSLETLLPLSKRPVTKLWASRRKIHCWESYLVRGKALGESLEELLPISSPP
jgi:hypothetical protein